MSNVKERPKRTIKRPTYLGYEYLMDDKKFDDDIEIIEDISPLPFQKLPVFEKTCLQNYQQLPHLSDEDLEILELPPPLTSAPFKLGVLRGEPSAPPGNTHLYYPHPTPAVSTSINLFDSFATHNPTTGAPAPPSGVNQNYAVTTPINPYHELLAENAAAAETFDRQVTGYGGAAYQYEPMVGAPYANLTPSTLSRDMELASRDDQGGRCPSVASCSPTSSLSSNGFASPEEIENSEFINPPYFSSSSSPLNESSATKSSSKMATGRRSGRASKMAAGPASVKNISSSSGSSRKKRKRDPNEPQKPVSAYALFFRDTQAAIKGQNPTATFGEVSKIVASMWDSLDNTRKEVYKKKTETAKKDYTKKLSEYRAKIASKNKGVPSCVSGGATLTSPTADALDAPDDVDRAAADERISAEAAYIERFYAENPNPQAENPDPPASRAECCERAGCGKWAVENLEWGDRYCSNECVVAHCKDVFNAWVSARQTSNTIEHSLPTQRTSVV